MFQQVLGFIGAVEDEHGLGDYKNGISCADKKVNIPLNLSSIS
jgi:hypothetical protein